MRGNKSEYLKYFQKYLAWFCRENTIFYVGKVLDKEISLKVYIIRIRTKAISTKILADI